MSGTIYCIMVPRVYNDVGLGKPVVRDYYYWAGDEVAYQKRHAKKYKTIAGAERALARAQKRYPNAFISEV